MRKSLLIGALLLSACTLGPDYKQPSFAFPGHWPWQSVSAAAPITPAQQQQALDWWTGFDDPALTALIAEGLKANDDLAAAAARVSQARALLSLTRANQYPEIDYQGGALRKAGSGEASLGGFPANSKPYNDFSLSLVLDYEISLWGKFQRANESARAELLSAQYNQDAVRLAVASEIATGYFNLRALDAQIAITNDTIATRQESYKYQNAQFRHGAVNGLTEQQAAGELAAAQAQLPVLKQAHEEQETALAVLLGRSPQNIVEGQIETGKAIDALPAPPAIPDDLPSGMLEHRPDIAAAEQDLVSANADIGAAKADFFPTISLSALLGLDASGADNLLRHSARTWSGGASLVGPLLDFGRNAASVASAESDKDLALAAYQRAVRSAFKDVLDAMNAQANADARAKADEDRTGALAEAARLAQLRYDAGYSTYLELLDTRRSLYGAQLDRVTAMRDRLTASVNLAKAMGGGWRVPH